MDTANNDILQLISDTDLHLLRDIYTNIRPKATDIYNYLSSVIRWKNVHPDTKYFSIYIPHGRLINGTFIGVNEFGNEIVMYTLEEDYQTLYKAISETKLIDWNTNWVLYAIHGHLIPVVQKALKQTDFEYSSSTPCGVWWMPKEAAINFEINCPEEIYIAPLEHVHCSTINSVWPRRFLNSDKYVAALIEMNGGYGVFLKSNGLLVAWVIQNLIGLGLIQTLDEYKRNGYGSLIGKYLSKVLAINGYDAVGTVLDKNDVSQNMFKKLGFKRVETVSYIDNVQFTSLLEIPI